MRLPPAALRLRPAETASDAESMRVFHNDALPFLTGDPRPIPPALQQHWFEQLNRETTKPFVVELEGEPGAVGYGLVRLDEVDSLYWLTGALRADLRSQGLGRHLFRKLIDVTDGRAKLEVRVNNDPALRLYRSLGFIPTKVEDRKLPTEIEPVSVYEMHLEKRPPILSVIFGTYNRQKYLRALLNGVRQTLHRVPHEIVICDGGSTDGTREFLAGEPDVLLIGERRLEGAVRAFNQAYDLSRGDYVAVINDDVAVINDALERAVQLFEKNLKVGQVAFGYRRGKRRAMISGALPGHIFANLGMIRRDVAERAKEITGGLWARCYHTYGADTELSCWVERFGFEIDIDRRDCFDDLLAPDELRERNAKATAAERDNRRFWDRWWSVDCLKPKGPMPRLSPQELAALTLFEETYA